MYELMHSLCDGHGIFLRREALAVGYTDRALYRAMRSKVIHRIRHGAYAFVDHWSSLDEVGQHLLRARAVVRSARTELALSHVTALAQLGAPVWDLPLHEVHVTRLDSRAGRREAGVAQHSGLVLPGDISQHDGVTITSPTRTALDLTLMTDVEHSLPVLDHLLRTGATTKAALRDGSRRRDVWPGSLATDLTIRLSDRRAESVGESRARYLFWRAGLPMPTLQFEVVDVWGQVVARVDFAWPDHGVFLEFDGKVKYAKPLRPGESTVDVVLREKKREELICWITGWRCIRIVWADLYRPHEVVEHIRSVLAGAPVH